MKKIFVSTILVFLLLIAGICFLSAANPDPKSPSLQITPNPYVFSPTFVGETTDAMFLFQNNGDEPLFVTDISFTNPVFSIDYTAFTIQPGESGELPVHFTPTGVDFFQGQMQVYSNDPINNPYQLQLNGAGITQFNMGWEWIETGFNYILMEIEFPEGQNQVGYCVGQSLTYSGVGIVIKTTDGGTTWTQLTPDGIPGLEGMSFVDMQTGYAAGWDGYVIKTTDGGLTWDTLDVAPGMWEISDIEFRDENHGVIAEYYGTYVTNDGGQNWTLATGMTIMPYKLDYASENVIFAAGGGGLCKSIDGGYTWTESYVGPLLLGLDFPNEQHGLVVGDYGVIMQTYDGGATWDFTQPVGDQLLRSAFIWDEDTAWVAGTPEMVYKSIDGGLSWEFGFNGNYQKAIYRITFTDNYTGFMCGGSGGIVIRKQGIGGPMLSIEPNPAVFPDTYLGETSAIDLTFANNGNEPLNVSNITFSDPGFSIDYTSFTIPPGESGELPIYFHPTSSGPKQAVMQVFSDDPFNNPYVVELSGNAVVELNMGWEWIETGFNYILMDIEFPEGQNQVGYSIGESLTYNGVGIVIKTTDGGSSWTQLTPEGIPGLEAMSFVDMQTGFAAGWDGYVIKTTDGGLNWDTLSVAAGMWEINDIEFYDASHGIIVEGPNIYLTEDGGLTWSAVAQIPEGGFKTEYVDANTLFIAANENYIYKSTDGGYTWQPKNTGVVGQLLLGIDFLNSDYGMAVGDYGNILTTVDGGETWTLDTQVGDQLLRSVYIWDEDTAWIVGTPELVYKTTNGGDNWSFGFSGNWQKAFYRITFTENYTGFICGGSGGIVLRKAGLPEIPEIAVSTNELNFDTVEVGETATEFFTVSNYGFGTLQVSNIESTNTAYTVSPENFTLSPGEEQMVGVSFTPPSAALFEGLLQVQSNDPGNPYVEISLSGTGFVAVPQIEIQPGEILFDTTLVNESSTEILTVTNLGIATLSVTDISSSNPVFTTNLQSFDLEPEDSQEVEVTFTPTGEMMYTATLQFESNDPVNPIMEIEVSGFGDIDTRIEEFDWKSDLLVYPNPTTDLLQIESLSGIAEIEVFNSIGQRVFIESNIGKNKFGIDFSGYKEGMYSMKVRLTDTSFIQRIIKK